MCDVLFVIPNLSSSVKHEVNGTMILGTILLNAGFDVEILRFSEIAGYKQNYPEFVENAVSDILARRPKCVSFYTLYTNYHIVLRLCEELKKRDSTLPLVLGGPQGSALAQETLLRFPSVDFVCTSEGEYTAVPFFSRLLRSEGPAFSDIPGLYFREEGQIKHNPRFTPLADLDSLPFWDDRLLMKEYNGKSEQQDPREYYMPVEVGRGCPYNCTFCNTSTFFRRTYRLKSPERIVKDIRFFKDKFGYQSFLLSHDALTANSQLISDLCDRITEANLDINWECSTRLDCLTPELVEKMKQSGLRKIHAGIETGSERMQKLTNKNLDLNQVKSMIKSLLDQKMYFVLFFVYGVPEETEEDLNDTLTMVLDLCDQGAPEVHMNLCMFAPDTALTARHLDELVYDPSKIPVVWNKFGFYEEHQMILAHKPLFSINYHLPTPVRDRYTYAKYLAMLYQIFPRTARYVRYFYHGDYLKFYRDFYENNLDLMNKGIPAVEKAMNTDPLELMLNTIRNIQDPAISYARELLRFEMDLLRIQRAKAGTVVRKHYGFRYHEYKLGCTIDQFTEGTSEILMVNRNGRVSVNLVNFT